MNIECFEVRREDLSATRVVSTGCPELKDGEILTQVECFALTANNITYAVVGASFGYWRFFPTEANWGIIPVWGFARVVDSRHADVKTGERLYGYFPMGTHLVMSPGKLCDENFTDEAMHRTELPPVYNFYVRTDREPSYDSSLDNERMLLFPLYATSFCLCDFLQDNSYFDASQIIILSASSKTAIGLAYGLRDDAELLPRVGLTSTRNKARVEALGLYTTVLTYDELNAVDKKLASVIVDMSGDGGVLSELHRILGDNMVFTSKVGATHYTANQPGPQFIRSRSSMFFAPGHIRKRTLDWGAEKFSARVSEFWYIAALRSRDWLVFEYYAGMTALPRAYRQVLEAKTSPETGIIVSLN